MTARPTAGLPWPLGEHKPLFIWDTKNRTCASAYAFQFPKTAEWWQVHMPEHPRIWRAEFYLIDTPFVVCYPFKTDGEGIQGRILFDPETKDAVLGEPYLAVLRELPPEDLRAGCVFAYSGCSSNKLQETGCDNWTIDGNCVSPENSCAECGKLGDP